MGWVAVNFWWIQRFAGPQGLVAPKGLGVPKASKVWWSPRFNGLKDLVVLKGHLSLQRVREIPGVWWLPKITKVPRT